MTKSYRVSFRLNAEYDQDLIDRLKQIENRNLSRVLRKIIRENIHKYETDNASDMKKHKIQGQTKAIQWKFPQ